MPTAIYSFHSAAFWHFWMQICGDQTLRFLTQQYVFAKVLISLGEVRPAPAKCQKRIVVLRAQSFGCRICTAPQPRSMMMTITSAVVNHVTNCWSKWKTNKCQDLQPDAFTHEGGGQVYCEKMADVCPKWSG